jgi:peptidoglycan/xylan/chitin deacetylase (PgdA/CDA1 family)
VSRYAQESKTWEDTRPFALGLSHDIDRVAKRWQFAYYLFQALVSLRLDELRQHLRSLQALLHADDPYWNFERIMTLEDDLGVHSTFFFLNEPGRASVLKPGSMTLFCGRYDINESRIRQIIRDLHAGGWEIAVHGSYHSYQDQRLLSSEKKQLEALVGESVKGIRQHYLNLDIPATWQHQAQAGFSYDSSLGYSDRVGFRWGAVHPFYPRDPLTGKKIPVLEIPLGIMDASLMRMDNPWQAVLSMIDRVEQEQGVLTINWHQRVFNPWEYREWQDMYVRIVRECERRGAWIAPLGEVAEWWMSHEGA